MPIRIPWSQREYLGIAFMLFGMCGFIQILIIFIAQYFLSVGNYLIVILIPIGVILATFYATILIFESFAQTERRKKLKDQFRQLKRAKTLWNDFLFFPITRPLLVMLGMFIPCYIITYYVCLFFLENIVSFVVAENVAAIACLLLANLLERYHGKVKRV